MSMENLPAQENVRLNFFDRIVLVVVTVLFCIMVLITWLQIVARNLSISISWAEEVCRYLMIIYSFIGAGLAFKTKEHIRIDVFSKKMKPLFKKCLDIVEELLTLGFLLFTLWGAWLMYQNTAKVPVGFTSTYFFIGDIYLLIIFAFLINVYYTIEQMVSHFRRKTN